LCKGPNNQGCTAYANYIRWYQHINLFNAISFHFIWSKKYLLNINDSLVSLYIYSVYTGVDFHTSKKRRRSDSWTNHTKKD
jgi:hypothetical protein